MDQYRVISADSHVTSPADCYVPRFPQRLKDRAPRVENAPDADYWVIEGRRQRFEGKSIGVKYEHWGKLTHRFAEAKHNGWDPAERLRDQDLDGVDAEEMYSGIVGGFAAGNIDDIEGRHATIQAYNDWLVDYCSHAPHRLIGMAVLPLWDVELGVLELRRVVKKGLAGAMIGVNDEKPAAHPYYDRLWATFQDLDVPAALHIGTTVGPATHMMGMPGVDTMAWISCDAFPMAEPIAAMIMTGVFERFPKLRLVPAESQAGWWGYMNQRMDDVWKRWKFRVNNSNPHEPSFYFHRNIFTTFQEDLLAMKIKDDIGVDNMMWASDYPHFASTWGRTQEVVAQHARYLTPAEKAKIFRANAQRVYKLGTGKLAAAGKATAKR